MQRIFNDYSELEKYLINNKCQKILLVCTHSFYRSNLAKQLKELDKEIIYFDEFEPNPKYESVCNAIKEYKENNCDYIMAVGGGSAIDVAKCIKAFVNMDEETNYLKQKIIPNDIELLVVPTTAGTGSEATHFAVIYYNDEKKSVADISLIPNAVLFDTNFLKTLPLRMKKTTILDAYSHAIESLWSVNSNEESKAYSNETIDLIIKNIDNYFENDESTFINILKAANLAGKAINITKTTAGHAMCYKLTSLYGIAHGHAAMLINSELYPYMIEHIDKCIDSRGIDYLKDLFNELSKKINCNLEESKEYFKNILKKYDLYNVDVDYKDLEHLTQSVNVERLSNNPVKLDSEDIKTIYTRLFDRIMEEKK